MYAGRHVYTSYANTLHLSCTKSELATESSRNYLKYTDTPFSLDLTYPRTVKNLR